MKRRYYMRGLGIGVLVTTVVFTLVIAFVKNNTTISDEQVYERAVELGYVVEKQPAQELNINELNMKLTPIPTDTPKENENSGSDADLKNTDME